MNTQAVELLKDLADVFDDTTSIVDDGRLEALASKYLGHEAPSAIVLQHNVLETVRKFLSDLDPKVAPSWSEAPSWATWLGQDYNGRWYWFEREPARVSSGYWAVAGGQYRMAKEARATNTNWHLSLQSRPF